ncbi:MAG: hypothetical protein ACU85V_12970 [Gammaproteobacteria bacterium]
MRHLVLVMSEPVAGQDEAYHDWYENTHLDEVLASAGWHSAERFELSDEQGLPCPRRFLALYEVEADDPSEILPHLDATRDQREQSAAIDRRNAGAWVFSPIGARRTRDEA